MLRTTHFDGQRINAPATRLGSAEMPAPAPGESNDRASRIIQNGNGHGPETHPPAPSDRRRHPAEMPPSLPTLEDPALEDPLILDEPDAPDDVEPKARKGRKR